MDKILLKASLASYTNFQGFALYYSLVQKFSVTVQTLFGNPFGFFKFSLLPFNYMPYLEYQFYKQKRKVYATRIFF